MKRFTRFAVLALLVLVSVSVLGAQKTTIKFWNYGTSFPTLDGEIGKYEKQLIAAFEKKNANIKVELEMLSFNGGPDKVNIAIASDAAPDVIFDFPGRITDYARKGLMVDLSSMFTAKQLAELNPTILEACKLGRSQIVQYPFNVANFMMTVNVSMFKEAGLEKMLPLNRPDRTWTTEEFTAALKAIKEKRPDVSPMVFFAKSNQGDQATRIMAINLFGGEYMNQSLTSYMQNKGGVTDFLKWVQDGVKEGYIAKGGEAFTSGDAIDQFIQGKAAFNIIWSNVLRNSNLSKKTTPFDDAFLPWPTPAGASPRLDTYIGTWGVFDNGDAKKAEAAKKFIDFVVNDPVWGPKNLEATGGFSPKKNAKSTYTDKEALFASTMVKYTNRYYNTVKGFAKMRTFWFPALQQVMLGLKTPQAAMDEFVENANKTLLD